MTQVDGWQLLQCCAQRVPVFAEKKIGVSGSALGVWSLNLSVHRNGLGCSFSKGCSSTGAFSEGKDIVNAQGSH